MSLASSSSRQKLLAAADGVRRSARHLWRAACAADSSQLDEVKVRKIGSDWSSDGIRSPGPTRRADALVTHVCAARPAGGSMSRGHVAHGQEGMLPASCLRTALQAKAVLALAFIMEEVSRRRTHEEKWAGTVPGHAHICPQRRRCFVRDHLIVDRRRCEGQSAAPACERAHAN